MDEIWKPVPDTDYVVSNTGKVASMKKGWRVLKPETNLGYPRVALCHHGKMASRLVHTLIANAFLPPRPSPLHEVNHKNGIKDDPRAENLEWVTRSENLRHRDSAREGKTHRGGGARYTGATRNRRKSKLNRRRLWDRPHNCQRHPS